MPSFAHRQYADTFNGECCCCTREGLLAAAQLRERGTPHHTRRPSHCKEWLTILVRLRCTGVRDQADHPSPLNEAFARIQAAEASHLPDLVLPLNTTSWAPNGCLVVPEVGELVVAEWAKEQLASMLGVRFDRWFARARAEERADEMSRRLQRAKNKVRLRLAQSENGPILRAIVSPSYTSIEDSSLLDAILTLLKGVNPQLHRLELTSRMTNIVLTVGEVQSRGGIVGVTWGALTITNSGVGWSGLHVVLSIIRLVCRNGMSAPLFEGQIIKAPHRSLDICKVRDLLATRIQSIPAHLSRATSTIEESVHWEVVNIEAEARETLRERGLIRSHLRGVLEAHAREPHRSVFGLSQAISLHAQQVSPEDRLTLEDLAGSYVLRCAP